MPWSAPHRVCPCRGRFTSGALARSHRFLQSPCTGSPAARGRTIPVCRPRHTRPTSVQARHGHHFAATSANCNVLLDFDPLCMRSCQLLVRPDRVGTRTCSATPAIAGRAAGAHAPFPRKRRDSCTACRSQARPLSARPWQRQWLACRCTASGTTLGPGRLRSPHATPPGWACIGRLVTQAQCFARVRGRPAFFPSPKSGKSDPAPFPWLEAWCSQTSVLRPETIEDGVPGACAVVDAPRQRHAFPATGATSGVL